MITRNFKHLAATILEASGSTNAFSGHLPVTSTNGKGYFLGNTYSYPGTVNSTFKTTIEEGISLGTGLTAPTEGDFDLENQIKSGIHVSTVVISAGVDTPDYPWVKFNLTVTNTGSEPITISEVGYKQKVKASNLQEGTSSSDVVVLLDRTLLDTPLTIGAGDAGVIEYKLETIHTAKYVNGVKIVSFAYGTDSEIADMIDAARNGDIDLQTDGGWQVGDTRTIHVNAFTTGSGECPAQDIDIAISQFGDYNNCGAMFQFDFVSGLSKTTRMNSSNTNVGGYDSSEMFTTTLPAFVNALPSWLQNRLKTFDVLASSGNQSSVIETISGNKLALRSEIEVFGAITNSKEGEGSVVDYYKNGGPRVKTQGRTGSTVHWWLRSPAGSSGSHFCHVANNGTPTTHTASNTSGVSPFGCI